MKTFIKTIFVGMILFASAVAMDRPQPWDSVTFTVKHGEGKAVVHLEGSKELTKVELSMEGKQLAVPEAELAGISSPQLPSAQLIFGQGFHGPIKEGEKPIPHYLIRFKYDKESKFGGYATVSYLFYGGQYRERIESVRISPTVWQDFRKKPGVGRIKAGTATRPE